MSFRFLYQIKFSCYYASTEVHAAYPKIPITRSRIVDRNSCAISSRFAVYFNEIAFTHHQVSWWWWWFFVVVPMSLYAHIFVKIPWNQTRTNQASCYTHKVHKPSGVLKLLSTNCIFFTMAAKYVDTEISACSTNTPQNLIKK